MHRKKTRHIRRRRSAPIVHEKTLDELREEENEQRRNLAGPPPARRFPYGGA